MSTEREVKLGVWPGFRLPDLDGVIEGVTVTEASERHLDAIYYDTPDARLGRAGASLRHRSGDGTGWTVKLAGDSSDGSEALVRRELTFPGSRSKVPVEAARLVVSLARTAALGPVARLHTLRRSRNLVDQAGQVVAEVVDDEVSVRDGRRVAARFREVEVEFGDDAPSGLVDAVLARLRAAGAGAPDQMSKVQRALGPLAAGPPELAPVPLAKDPAAADVIRTAMTASVLRLLEHDPAVRLGESAEAVHQMRVATRRLRSDLRTYGALLDAEWASGLREDLRELAAALGAVRDTDVLLERLGGQGDAVAPDDAEALGTLLGGLTTERDEARRRLLEVLDGVAYAGLLDRLVEGARQPQVLQEAAGRAAEVLPSLVLSPWKSLRNAAEAVKPDGPDDDLHDVRIKAKRCRYAVEVAALVVGKPASRFAREVAGLQDLLGTFQDAVVAEAWLRGAVGTGTPAGVAYVAGWLSALNRTDAESCRLAFDDAWRSVRRPRLGSWLTSS